MMIMDIDLQTIVAISIAIMAVLYLAYRGLHFFRSGGAGGCGICSASGCSQEPDVHEIQSRLPSTSHRPETDDAGIVS